MGNTSFFALSIFFFIQSALSALEILIDCKVKLEEADRQDLLHKAWSALQSVNILVNNILDMNKIQAHGIRLIPKKVNIRRAAIQALRLIEIQAKQENVSLVLDAASFLPSTIRCDRHLLSRVLVNLTAQALNVTSNEGRIVLRLSYDSERQNLIGMVIDDGAGMTTDELALVFTNQSHRKDGMGLGLSVCNRLVSEMGGSISAFSEGRNCGSTFRFEIPAPAIKFANHSLDCTVLVVDDDSVRSKALKEMLQYAGVSVLEEGSAETLSVLPKIVFICLSQRWDVHARVWRQRTSTSISATTTVTTICVTVPNTFHGKVAPAHLFDCTLRLPVDIAELRGVLRSVLDTVDSDTSSHFSLPASTTQQTLGHNSSRVEGGRGGRSGGGRPSASHTNCSSSAADFNATLSVGSHRKAAVMSQASHDESADERTDEISVLLVDDNAANHHVFKKYLVCVYYLSDSSELERISWWIAHL